jgi:DNA-binding transcriptional regulator YiaG
MTWADRIKALIERLGTNQSRFGQLLGVNFQTVWRWTHGLFEPNDSLIPIIEALERDPEGARQKLLAGELTVPFPARRVRHWRDLKVGEWTLARINALLEELNLDSNELAHLLNMDTSSTYQWLHGRPPGVCAEILLELLEIHGPNMAEIIYSTKVGPGFSGDEVESILKTIQEKTETSLRGLAYLFRIDAQNLYRWISEGAPSGCHTTFLELLKQYPDDMIAAFKDRD